MALETYETVLSGTLSGQFVQNIFHFSVVNTGSVDPYTEAEDLVNTMIGAGGFVDELMKIYPSGYSATSLRARRIQAQGGPTAIALVASFTDGTGDRSGAIQTYQASPCLVWITTPRPNKVGKTYIPGISETDCDAGQFTSAFVTAVGVFIAFAVTPGTLTGSGDTFQLAIFRRGLGATDDVTAGRLSPKPAVQKRRALPV